MQNTPNFISKKWRLMELKRILLGRHLSKTLKSMSLTSEATEKKESRRVGIMNAIKMFLGMITKNKSIIGKIIISLIAILAFYRCIISPPVYYRGFHNSKVYDKKVSYDEIPTIDIYKMTSELLGLGILGGLVYFTLVRKKDKW